MKITKKQLKQIILEEVAVFYEEDRGPGLEGEEWAAPGAEPWSDKPTITLDPMHVAPRDRADISREEHEIESADYPRGEPPWKYMTDEPNPRKEDVDMWHRLKGLGLSDPRYRAIRNLLGL